MALSIYRPSYLKESKKRKRSMSVPSAPKVRMPLSLQRYINTRGTPDGTYELCRTVTGNFTVIPAGIAIGPANYEGATFVVNPQSLQLVSGVAGNTTTWNIPNASEMAALWDKVKIDKVEYTFTCTTPTVTNSGTGQLPLFIFAEDDNDTAASLSSVSQMNCKSWQPGWNTTEFKISSKPRYQRIVYYTAVLSSYEPTRGYVVSDTAIPHYGLKMAIQQPPSAASNGMLVQFAAKIHFKFKELK